MVSVSPQTPAREVGAATVPGKRDDADPTKDDKISARGESRSIKKGGGKKPPKDIQLCNSAGSLMIHLSAPRLPLRLVESGWRIPRLPATAVPRRVFDHRIIKRIRNTAKTSLCPLPTLSFPYCPGQGAYCSDSQRNSYTNPYRSFAVRSRLV